MYDGAVEVMVEYFTLFCTRLLELQSTTDAHGDPKKSYVRDVLPLLHYI
jgi:hypothetical protein